MAALIMLVQFVATLTTITLFLAGLPTARKIATAGDTAQFSVVPWLAQVRCNPHSAGLACAMCRLTIAGRPMVLAVGHC
jgi:hypothetical protein